MRLSLFVHDFNYKLALNSYLTLIVNYKTKTMSNQYNIIQKVNQKIA